MKGTGVGVLPSGLCQINVEVPLEWLREGSHLISLICGCSSRRGWRRGMTTGDDAVSVSVLGFPGGGADAGDEKRLHRADMHTCGWLGAFPALPRMVLVSQCK